MRTAARPLARRCGRFQEALAANIPGAVLISAEKRWGLEALRAALVEVIDRERTVVRSG